MAELLVAVGILAILGVIAMPAFSSLMQTYRLNAATLELTSNLRYAQSLAVSNGASYRFHWGNDLNQPNTYRVEKSINAGGTSWPSANAMPGSDPNVITDWVSLDTSYPGVTLSAVNDANNTSLSGVVFNARGSTVVPSPINLTVTPAAGTAKTIQVRRTGSVKIL